MGVSLDQFGDFWPVVRPIGVVSGAAWWLILLGLIEFIVSWGDGSVVPYCFSLNHGFVGGECIVCVKGLVVV